MLDKLINKDPDDMEIEDLREAVRFLRATREGHQQIIAALSKAIDEMYTEARHLRWNAENAEKESEDEREIKECMKILRDMKTKSAIAYSDLVTAEQTFNVLKTVYKTFHIIHETVSGNSDAKETSHRDIETRLLEDLRTLEEDERKARLLINTRLKLVSGWYEVLTTSKSSVEIKATCRTVRDMELAEFRAMGNFWTQEESSDDESFGVH